MYCNCKNFFMMRLNEHRKKGCEKAVDEDKNPLTFKLYLPLKNAAKGVILAKGGNVLEYRAKLEISLKPKRSRAIVTKIIPLEKEEGKEPSCGKFRQRCRPSYRTWTKL